MLEPGVRYLPHPGPAALNLDAAVDLSKKSSVGYVSKSVYQFCLTRNTKVCGLPGRGGGGRVRLGHPPGHERDCHSSTQSSLSWLCQTILAFASQANLTSTQPLTMIDQTRNMFN